MESNSRCTRVLPRNVLPRDTGAEGGPPFGAGCLPKLRQEILEFLYPRVHLPSLVIVTDHCLITRMMPRLLPSRFVCQVSGKPAFMASVHIASRIQKMLAP
jgi:hypothetical protein